MARLNINGKTYDVDVDPSTPLLWAIREQVGLTGTKYGCGVAQCGSCTVHIDGVAMRSCATPVSAVIGRQITTIEGIAENGVLTKVQQAWLANEVPQCGYCQSGMMIAAADLLERIPNPTLAQVKDAFTNTPPSPHLCRCGTYNGIATAVLKAAQMMKA